MRQVLKITREIESPFTMTRTRARLLELGLKMVCFKMERNNIGRYLIAEIAE